MLTGTLAHTLELGRKTKFVLQGLKFILFKIEIWKGLEHFIHLFRLDLIFWIFNSVGLGWHALEILDGVFGSRLDHLDSVVLPEKQDSKVVIASLELFVLKSNTRRFTIDLELH